MDKNALKELITHVRPGDRIGTEWLNKLVNAINDTRGGVNPPSQKFVTAGGGGQSGTSGFSGFNSASSGYSGFSGKVGTTGIPGSKIETDHVDPGILDGSFSDVWINTLTWNVFQKDIGTWNGVGNISGASGVSGGSGYSALSGYSGTSGASGQSGYSGQKGVKGDTGDAGAAGADGAQGLSGYSGISGQSGYSGISGTSGTSGWSAFSGKSGVSGFSGASGYSGAVGSLSVAAYCSYVTTGTNNCTLSGSFTPDGTSVNSGKVLLASQTTGSTNGLYTASAGSWTKVSPDPDTVAVQLGTSNAQIIFIKVDATPTYKPTYGVLK